MDKSSTDKFLNSTSAEIPPLVTDATENIAVTNSASNLSLERKLAKLTLLERQLREAIDLYEEARTEFNTQLELIQKAEETTASVKQKLEALQTKTFLRKPL